jgi:hypothetical protein
MSCIVHTRFEYGWDDKHVCEKRMSSTCSAARPKLLQGSLHPCNMSGGVRHADGRFVQVNTTVPKWARSGGYFVLFIIHPGARDHGCTDGAFVPDMIAACLHKKLHKHRIAQTRRSRVGWHKERTVHCDRARPGIHTDPASPQIRGARVLSVGPVTARVRNGGGAAAAIQESRKHHRDEMRLS